MYIKKVRKSNKGSGKIYEYLHLLGKIRTDKAPRQRLILNLGAPDLPADQFYERANCIEAMLLCRSSARKDKDLGIRSRQEQLFVERLQYFHDGLSLPWRTKLYDKIVEKVERLREKYPRASKLYDVEVRAEEKPGKRVKAAAIAWSKKEQYDQVVEFDGCAAIPSPNIRRFTVIWG